MYFTRVVNDPFQRRPRSLSCFQHTLGEHEWIETLKNAQSRTVEEVNGETAAKAVITRSFQSMDHWDWTLAYLLHWTAKRRSRTDLVSQSTTQLLKGLSSILDL